MMKTKSFSRVPWVPLTGQTSLCCAKAYCFALYTRKALDPKTPHWGVFFTASPLSGPIPISKNTGYPIGVSGILESMNSFDAENDLFHIAYINAPEKAANIISKIGESFFLAKCL